MSPQRLREIRDSARRATRDARDATAAAHAANRGLSDFRMQNAVAREEMWRRIGRSRRSGD
jgi:hypothetical protein